MHPRNGAFDLAGTLYTAGIIAIVNANRLDGINARVLKSEYADGVYVVSAKVV